MPSARLRPHGRRPHRHNDREKDYIDERVKLDRLARLETGDKAILDVDRLPSLVAYPNHPFDYENQNSHGRDRQRDVGYCRIITNPQKEHLGLSYHPLNDNKNMVRAEKRGAFVADYTPNYGGSTSGGNSQIPRQADRRIERYPQNDYRQL